LEKLESNVWELIWGYVEAVMACFSAILYRHILRHTEEYRGNVSHTPVEIRTKQK
jgi:hypothetical protein